MARPQAKIDWNKVGERIKAQCFATGIASSLGISVDTLYLRCKKDLNIDYTEFSEQKKAEGVEMLREKQYKLAMEGDRTLLVWLGKQYLGQSEKQEMKHEFKNELPVNFVIKRNGT